MRSPRWQRNRRLKCECGGYWFPHRRASGSCEQRADKLAALLVVVRRESRDVLQAQADWFWDHPGQPFNEWKEEPVKLYQVLDGADGIRYVGTMTDAQAAAKSMPKQYWPEVVVNEVEVPTDKAGLIGVLNSDGDSLKVIKTYELTPRGGLKEAA